MTMGTESGIEISGSIGISLESNLVILNMGEPVGMIDIFEVISIILQSEKP